MLSVEERLQIINFIYPIKACSYHCKAILDYCETEDQLNKVKELLYPIQETLFQTWREGRKETNIQDYKWLLEGSFQDLILKYINNTDEKPLFEYTNALKLMLIDEITYELENDVRYGFFELINASRYFHFYNIHEDCNENHKYTLIKDTIKILPSNEKYDYSYGKYLIKVQYKRENEVVDGEVEVLYNNKGVTNIKVLGQKPSNIDEKESCWLKVNAILKYSALTSTDLLDMSNSVEYFIEEIGDKIYQINKKNKQRIFRRVNEITC